MRLGSYWLGQNKQYICKWSHSLYLYAIVPFLILFLARKASLVKPWLPWFVFWLDCISPKYEPCLDQTRRLCRRSVPKKVWLGLNTIHFLSWRYFYYFLYFSLFFLIILFCVRWCWHHLRRTVWTHFALLFSSVAVQDTKFRLNSLELTNIYFVSWELVFKSDFL